MGKLKAVFAVLWAGKSLSNPSAWKNAQLVSNMLLALIGLANAFGFSLLLDSQTINHLVLTIVGVSNAYFVTATDPAIGVPNKTIRPDLPDLP